MAINTNDMTVERKYLDTYRFMIRVTSLHRNNYLEVETGGALK